jgi:hypothetical protein
VATATMSGGNDDQPAQRQKSAGRPPARRGPGRAPAHPTVLLPINPPRSRGVLSRFTRNRRRGRR